MQLWSVHTLQQSMQTMKWKKLSMPNWTQSYPQFTHLTSSTFLVTLTLEWSVQLWSETTEKNAVDMCNTITILLHTKCAEHDLIIVNTIFRQKQKFKVSWQHPRSSFTLVTKDVFYTKTLTGADDFWTNHCLICFKNWLSIWLKRRLGHCKAIKRFNIYKVQDPAARAEFQQCFAKEFPMK